MGETRDIILRRWCFVILFLTVCMAEEFSCFQALELRRLIAVCDYIYSLICSLYKHDMQYASLTNLL